MDNELPNDFDLIIVGTGMIESIVSAAASRIGKKVLHIDSDDYYGGQWASFNLDAIQKLQTKQVPSNINDLGQENVTPIGNDIANINNVFFNWHIPEKEPSSYTSIATESEDKSAESVEQNNQEITEDTQVWTKDSLLKETRKFNIDLTPKLQYARGVFVELLISSNIARYTEYRSVSRILTWFDGELEDVPCSRSDVFASNRISVMEKRLLMKFLTTPINPADINSNTLYYNLLLEKGLTPRLVHNILYCISMGSKDTKAVVGLENTERFVNSLGRFGKTPFIYSMYGSGEMTQAFCRLSAVFGGIFALSQPLKGYVFDDKGFKYLLVDKQRIRADNIVMGIDKAPKKFIEHVPFQYVSRAVFITDKSVLQSEKEPLTLLLYPSEDEKKNVMIIELGSTTGTCPKDLFIVHLIAKSTTNPQDDFKHVVDKLFVKDEDSSLKPRILWSFYFSIPDYNSSEFEETVRKNTPENVYVCAGPDFDLDCDVAVKEAKKIFTKMYPDMEFLPRAPDPEEIVLESDDEVEIATESEEIGSGDAVVEELVQNIQNQNITEDA